MVLPEPGQKVTADGWIYDDYGMEADTVPLVPRSQARISAMAAFGLVLGLIALVATLTGLLALLGVAVGTVAITLSVLGLVGVDRERLGGRSLAVAGVVCGVGAVMIGLLAIGGHLSWLSSSSDEVGQLHEWLDRSQSCG